MKVQSGNISHQQSIASTSNSKSDAKLDSLSAKDAKGSDSSATVNISERAQTINKIKELATPDMDTVREDKVAHFQNLIDNGKYEVDASSVADSLVDSHLIR